MAEPPTDADRRPLQRLQTVVDLIETPALARIYACTEREDSVTVGELVDELAIPQGTAYDYVQRLETVGLLRRIKGASVRVRR
jgi:Mn-dependent DtxR family transcriptional regulator